MSRFRISPLCVVAGLAIALTACVVKQGGAQVQTARVSTKDSVRITVVSTRVVVHDTVRITKIVHDSLCYAGTPLARITCPAATPTPVPTPVPPSPTPAPVDTTPLDTSSHEPAGMTLIAERAWNRLGEWGYDQLEDPNLASKYVIAQDATAPKSPPSIATFLYPAGFTSAGASPALSETGLRGRVLYASIWMRVSANWYGHSSEVFKTLHFWTENQNKLIPELTGQGSSPLTPTIAIQNTVTSGSRLYDPNLVPTARFSRGVWHRMEYVIDGNTSGAADGRVQWWMDGVKVGDIGGLQFNSGAVTWSTLKVDGTWGGSGGPTVPAMQTWSVDHIRVSSRP